MNPGDGKLVAFVVGNVSLTSVTIFVQKILPLLSAGLIVLQGIAAAYTVYHIFKKRKNEKIPDDPAI